MGSQGVRHEWATDTLKAFLLEISRFFPPPLQLRAKDTDCQENFLLLQLDFYSHLFMLLSYSVFALFCVHLLPCQITWFFSYKVSIWFFLYFLLMSFYHHFKCLPFLYGEWTIKIATLSLIILTSRSSWDWHLLLPFSLRIRFSWFFLCWVTFLLYPFRRLLLFCLKPDRSRLNFLCHGQWFHCEFSFQRLYSAALDLLTCTPQA